MATLVLTVIGEDRPGLVDALSRVVAEHGGSWERSQMARLAGRFAGIVLVAVPDRAAEKLIAALGSLRAESMLELTVERGTEAESVTGELARLDLHLIGTDRPGIIHDISHALASAQVSIETLETLTREAPMAGGMLFEATATLLAPPGSDLVELQAILESLANELMIDLSLSTQ